VTFVAENCALAVLAKPGLPTLMTANKPSVARIRRPINSRTRNRNDRRPATRLFSLSPLAEAGSAVPVTVEFLKCCQSEKSRNRARASSVATCGSRANCPFNNRLMVLRLISTPVFDSIVSERNCRSRCTRLARGKRPALRQTSAMPIATNAWSLTGFACILDVFEWLLAIKLKRPA